MKIAPWGEMNFRGNVNQRQCGQCPSRRIELRLRVVMVSPLRTRSPGSEAHDCMDVRARSTDAATPMAEVEVHALTPGTERNAQP